MDTKSSMLRRVRASNTANRLKIPKKGRIRAILVFAGLLVVWRVFSGGKSAGPEESSAGKPGSGAPVADAGEQKKKQSKPRSPVKKKNERISFENVGHLLKKYPPPRFAARDTLHFKKESWIVHYSLDTVLQQFGKKLFRRYHPQYGAAVAIEPSTGKIRGLLCFTHDSAAFLGNDLYGKSIYPAASIFKTITASAALEKANMTPSSCIKLTGRRYTLYNFQLEENLDNFKDISLSEAFAYSINPVFGRIGIYRTGGYELQQYARRFGFESSVPFELAVEKSRVMQCDSSFCVAELASGFNQQTTMSPIHGALIASAVAAGGAMPFPRLVDSISDCTTGTIYYSAASSTWKQPVTAATAAQLRTMMTRVARNGTARSSFRYMRNSFRFKDVEYGGKTGSVDKDGLGKVDWFVGFACHDRDPRQRIAVSVVTVHNANWTVHSSYIGAELMRRYIRNIQLHDEKQKELAEKEGSGVKSEG
ncbi:MAG: hypothetical protein GF350_12900 [Chitinivibrionales bacterium]|nr:hypothetical protein [Chitinivibrionales bacterium]